MIAVVVGMFVIGGLLVLFGGLTVFGASMPQYGRVGSGDGLIAPAAVAMVIGVLMVIIAFAMAMAG